MCMSSQSSGFQYVFEPQNRQERTEGRSTPSTAGSLGHAGGCLNLHQGLSQASWALKANGSLSSLGTGVPISLRPLPSTRGTLCMALHSSP